MDFVCKIGIVHLKLSKMKSKNINADKVVEEGSLLYNTTSGPKYKTLMTFFGEIKVAK